MGICGMAWPATTREKVFQIPIKENKNWLQNISGGFKPPWQAPRENKTTIFHSVLGGPDGGWNNFS